VKLAEKKTAKALPEAAGLFCLVSRVRERPGRWLFCFGEPGAGAPGSLARTGAKAFCKKTKQFCFGCKE